MILCCGETLIDFIPATGPDGAVVFRPAVGGSPGNVAVTVGRLGVPVGFVGGVSTDLFGDRIAAFLALNDVSTAFVSRLDRPTMLAFVDLDGEEPRYAFYDSGTAARHWRLDRMPVVRPEVTALHFGSLSVLRPPAADDFAALMEREASRRLISFDPNIRPALIEEGNDVRRRLEAFFRRAHIIKLSRSDLAWFAPARDPDEMAAEWLAAEALLVVLTGGPGGAIVYGRAGTFSRPAVPVDVVDTVGAGDALMGGLLAALYERGRLNRHGLARLGAIDLPDILDFAQAVAALACSQPGADPPRRTEVDGLLVRLRGAAETRERRPRNDAAPSGADRQTE